jgi:hypothetical protein
VKKKRKARVTKEMAHQFAEDQKLTTAKRKKIITPGPWTKLTPTFTLDVSFRKHTPITKLLEPYFGIYREDNNWSEKAWFPISFNITAPNLGATVLEHGLDMVLAAAEKALNVNTKLYGDLVLLYVVSDNSQRSDAFISCRAKTNKRNILGFAAQRNQVLTVLTKANIESPNDPSPAIQTSSDL